MQEKNIFFQARPKNLPKTPFSAFFNPSVSPEYPGIRQNTDPTAADGTPPRAP